MPSALITVVLPIFNAERTISLALKSILAQTYDRFEVIAIDDGSTDASSDLLADLASKDKRVKVVRTENRGVTAALNTGLSAAHGDFFARMDADDISERDRFERQVAHLAQHKACIAVGCCVNVVDDSGIPFRKQPQIPSSIRMRDRCKNFRHFPPSPPVIPHPTAMIRLAEVKAIGGYRTCFKSAQDRDLWWRLSERGEIHCLPDRLLRHRRHVSAVSRTHPERSVADSLISDLSAIARYFGVEDFDLLEEYGSKRAPSLTIQRYARLLGQRYPVAQLANFRAITRGYPSIAGHKNSASALRYSIRQLLRTPFSPKSYRLVSALLSQN